MRPQALRGDLFQILLVDHSKYLKTGIHDARSCEHRPWIPSIITLSVHLLDFFIPFSLKNSQKLLILGPIPVSALFVKLRFTPRSKRKDPFGSLLLPLYDEIRTHFEQNPDAD